MNIAKGQRVYLSRNQGWSSREWVLGTVTKVTARGLFDVTWGNNQSSVRFNSDLRERGERWHGWSVDDQMSFEDRSRWVARENRLKVAQSDLSKLLRKTENTRVEQFEKNSLIEFVDMMAVEVAKIRKQAEEI